ncbi:putative laminin subunit gamma-2, partial [Triplophysa rosa]
IFTAHSKRESEELKRVSWMWKMKSSWILLCSVCVWFPVQATFRAPNTCYCYGKAQYCKADHLGLHCINCQGNTEGRQCENCKEGYYHQRAGDDCVPCDCNTAGSQGPACNNEGRCTCKPGIHGDKCDRCHDGSPVTVNGLSCRSRHNGQLTYNREECLPCFCYGHSDVCTSAQGYSIHNITSTFEHGPEGWRAATDQGVTPSEVRFRWSPTHKDLEVISKDILPFFLFAPASYLGNQALSYGQTLIFSLRLDRGVRRPSTSDVILEGAGLRVSASLGNLRTVVPCGKKLTFTFTLDEQPGSKWRPQLSSLEFQTLLSNLTAIKIRGTFGENGRGYLDDVTLVSAKLGPGAPAVWVEKCSCSAAYEGLFCERCATGYRRRFPGQGPRSPCDPCSCQGGTCDPETGGCYSADEIPNLQMCPKGYYINRQRSNTCLRCPCPEGEACFVIPGSEDVICARCPHGSTGSRCEICAEGFYGDPLGEYGPPRPCQPCQCYNRLDEIVEDNCDPLTGECRRCPNHSTGPRCENCVEGYFHRYPTEPCQACDCNQKGSVSDSCNSNGQCKCREGYEGLKCEESTCPSCFNPVKSQISAYAQQLRDMEDVFNTIGGDNNVPVKDAEMDRAVKAAEVMLQSLQTRANELTDSEKLLQDKLVSISRNQLREERNMEAVLKTVNGVRNRDQQYKTEVSEIQKLISDIRLKLQQAKRDVQQIELPSGDAEEGSGTLSYLVQRAADLAEQHQGGAVTIENIANNALSTSEKALNLIRTAIDTENRVKDEVKDLKKQYEADVTKVSDMERKAIQLTGEAEKESKLAQGALKQISDLEKNLPKPLKKEIAGVIGRFDGLKEAVEGSITQYQDLQKNMLAGQKEAAGLLDNAKTLQKVQDELFARANAADAIKNKSLEIYAKNKDSLDNTLEKLKGFDDQINNNRKLADEAISKLPGIEATIQKATADNTKTQDILDAMAVPYKEAQDMIDALKNNAAQLEGLSGSLPPAADILNTASKLTGDLDGLNIAASLTKDRLNKEKSNVKTQINQAKEAVIDATGALDHAKTARNAVSDTLKTINDIMGSLGSPGVVDETRVSELESAVAEYRSRVEKELRPRFRELEEKEAQQRASITGMINDIDVILTDIANLEHIRRSIPDGCYNLPPLERP